MGAIAILEQYNTDHIKNQLLELPALILRQKQNTASYRERLKEAQQSQAEAEAMLVAAIAAEINPNTGKPAFSNAEARAAELTRRKAVDPGYCTAAIAVKQADQDLCSAQFELERLQDQFRAYRYIADLTARELALLASGIEEEVDGAREYANGNGNNGHEFRKEQPF